MAEYKVLPNSLESEVAVLGSVLIDQEAQTEILTSLSADDFYSSTHRDIFSAMQKIFAKSIPVDFVTLTSELEVEKLLDKVGGIDYITYLTNAVPSAANFKHYVDIVLANATRRNLITGGQKIIEDAFGNTDERDSMRNAEQIIFDLSQKRGSSDLELVGKPGGTIAAVINKINEIAKNPGQMRGLSTGFTELDNYTSGLQKGTLNVIAARPGVGKTSFAMNIATHVACEEGKNVAVFSLEMSREELMQRALGSLAKVKLTNMIKGTLEDDEWQRIWTAQKKLVQSGIYVDPSTSVKPLDIISKCRKLKMTKGLDLIVIDYLQLMSSDKKVNEGRTQEITGFTRTLKVAAKDMDVPILLLSQLSRDSEKREGDHKPKLSDLRDSGSIEQDADLVMFLYDPAQYNDVVTEDEPGTVYLLLSKHRSGSTGEIKLKWMKDYTTFTNPPKSVNINNTEDK